MKNLIAPLLASLIAASGSAAWAQSTTNRVRQGTTAVRPAPAVTVPATAPAVPAATLPGRRLNPGDRIRVDEPIPQVTPRRDRIDVNQPINRLALAPALAAVYEPLRGQVEVFGIDAHGTLKNVWKPNDGFWEPSFSMSAPGLAPPGAPLAAVWYPMNEQLEVFTIATNGALTVTYKAHNLAWAPPSYITPPNFAAPGAQIAAVVQPLNNQLEVFAIDPTGAVKVAWKAQNGRWLGPVTLTPAGIAPAGAPLAAVWQPLNEQLEVFFVDTAGALRVLWKQHNQHWAQTTAISAPGFLTTRTKLAAIWQPLNEQLEVFAVNRAGAINVMWKAHNSRWYGPQVIGGPEIARGGTDIMALWDAREQLLSVYTVGLRGNLIKTWKIKNGSWKPGPGAYSNEISQPGAIGSWPLGAALTGVIIPRDPYSQRELYTIDDDLAVRVVNVSTYGYGPRPNITTANYGPIYGTHAAYCSNVFRAWSGGQGGLDTDEKSPLATCSDFMGITAYCDSKNAGVAVGYIPQTTIRVLQCSERGHPENVVEQFVHIWTGIGQGLGEAAVASYAYAPQILQGYACLDGVAFACASLAVDLASRAISLPPELKDAIDIANDASGCVDGDIVACAKLGAAGARAVGVAIPGEDAGQIALLTQQCANGDYGACVRLGERAAMASGLPLGEINQAAKDAQDCYAGDMDACIALGRKAAAAGIPVGGLANGADNLQQCSYGRYDNCRELGKAVAATVR